MPAIVTPTAAARYRKLCRDFLAAQRNNASMEEREKLLTQIDELWSTLSLAERTEMGNTMAPEEPATEPKAPALAPVAPPAERRSDVEIRADCVARYIRVRTRAWRAGAIAVVAFSDWSSALFFDCDLHPGAVTKTKAPGGQLLRNFIDYSSGTLTSKQAADLFNACFSARKEAPPNAIIYAFSFPSDHVMPEGMLEEIVGADGILEGVSDA